MVEVWIDGLCEPVIPKYARTACLGYVIKKNGRTIAEGSEVIGKGSNMTNNVAEYTALIRAIERISSLKLDEEKIVIKSDSKLVVNQMKGEWKVRAELIIPLFYKAKAKSNGMNIDFQWIPRKKNIEADNLARIAYESART